MLAASRACFVRVQSALQTGISQAFSSQDIQATAEGQRGQSLRRPCHERNRACWPVAGLQYYWLDHETDAALPLQAGLRWTHLLEQQRHCRARQACQD